jgi:uncharacterized Fe-S cluster-containing radical SAM superfamily protein
MFDSVALASSTAEEVWKKDLRKYYRFRPFRFNGGITTADCVGCCLRCGFCWSRNVTTETFFADSFSRRGFLPR